ncbi:MAG: hypothetical protein QXZ71_01710, partial [Candidatus Caldarchaeum sp.]
MSESVLLKGGIVVTMDAVRRVIVDGAVGFEKGVITFVGKSEEASKAGKFDRVLDVSGRFVMPGLVCA